MALFPATEEGGRRLPRGRGRRAPASFLRRLGRRGGLGLLLLLDQRGDLALFLASAFFCCSMACAFCDTAFCSAVTCDCACDCSPCSWVTWLFSEFSAVCRLSTASEMSPSAIWLYSVVAPSVCSLPLKIGFCAAAVPSEM